MTPAFTHAFTHAFTLIGDLVGSRTLPDRAGAQQQVAAALSAVNAELVSGRASGGMPPLQPLEATVGDEFQGLFPSVGDAVLAAVLVRLELLPDIDVRCGIGHGEVVVHDASRRPLLQDGPGWWSARDALEELARPRRASARTWYAGPDAARVNAFLLTRDALVDRLGERGPRLLAHSLRGLSQREIAVAEGVSPSAISQQFARGVGALRDAQLSFAKGD